MQCTKLTHECRPKWRRFLSAQRIKENLLTGTFHCVQPSPCCFFYVLCFQIAVACSSHPTTLIHHHVAKYFRRDIRLCQNHFRFCRFSFAVISLLFRVQTINYVSGIFHDLKRNSWLFPDAPWPFQFLEFPWLSSGLPPWIQDWIHVFPGLFTDTSKHIHFYIFFFPLFRFDTAGWAAGRASGL